MKTIKKFAKYIIDALLGAIVMALGLVLTLLAAATIQNSPEVQEVITVVFVVAAGLALLAISLALFALVGSSVREQAWEALSRDKK